MAKWLFWSFILFVTLEIWLGINKIWLGMGGHITLAFVAPLTMYTIKRIWPPKE